MFVQTAIQVSSYSLDISIYISVLPKCYTRSRDGLFESPDKFDVASTLGHPHLLRIPEISAPFPLLNHPSYPAPWVIPFPLYA